jgi:hypothetical protein
MAPGRADIAKLVAFLPQLEAEGFVVIEWWGG